MEEENKIDEDVLDAIELENIIKRQGIKWVGEQLNKYEKR